MKVNNSAQIKSELLLSWDYFNKKCPCTSIPQGQGPLHQLIGLIPRYNLNIFLPDLFFSEL